MTLPTRWNASDQSLWHQTAAESWTLSEIILKRFMFPAMYGGKGNVDESQVCLQCVWVGNVAPVVIAFLSLQPKDFARWLVQGLSDRGRCCRTDSKASSVRNIQSQVHAGFRQGRNGEVLLSRESEARNYDISIALNRRELNICSEARSNIIQVRGDSAHVCVSMCPLWKWRGKTENLQLPRRYPFNSIRHVT